MASDTTLKLLEELQKIEAGKPSYTPSEKTVEFANQLKNVENSKPQDYQSKYQSTLDSLIGQITNRKPFSYDFNADAVYQQYKDVYTKLGNEASMNAVANASAMTGGYGNSYATTAAAQANQQQLSQLNNIIPQLADAALARYDSDTSKLMNQAVLYGDQEDRNYSKYRDQMSDFYTNRDYYAGRYDNAEQLDYGKYRDALSDWMSNREYAERRYNSSVSQDNWQAQFEYQKQQDALAAAQAAAAQAARTSSSSGSSSSRSSKSGSTSTVDLKTTDNWNDKAGKRQSILNVINSMLSSAYYKKGKSLTKKEKTSVVASALRSRGVTNQGDYNAFMAHYGL